MPPVRGTHQRGRVECMGAVLLALREGPLYHNELRLQTRMYGSTLYTHLAGLFQQKLIEEWIPHYAVTRRRFNRKYYRLTVEGLKAARHVQLILEWLGLPDPREAQR